MYVWGCHKTMGPKLKLICHLELKRKAVAGVREGVILFGAPKGKKAIRMETEKQMCGKYMFARPSLMGTERALLGSSRPSTH